MAQNPQTDLQAQARELLGRDLSPAEIAAAGARFPAMLHCLRLMRAWSAQQRPATMATVFRVPVGPGRNG